MPWVISRVIFRLNQSPKEIPSCTPWHSHPWVAKRRIASWSQIKGNAHWRLLPMAASSPTYCLRSLIKCMKGKGYLVPDTSSQAPGMALTATKMTLFPNFILCLAPKQSGRFSPFAYFFQSILIFRNTSLILVARQAINSWNRLLVATSFCLLKDCFRDF